MTTALKRTRIRYVILTLIFIATTLNYVDRATLSIAGPAMSREFGFDAVTLGLAFSAFGWAYTAMQLPGGWILDRFGPRWVYGCGLIAWSAMTVMQGFVGIFANAFLAIFVLRFLMGAAESPAFPANSRLTVMWFPLQERGLATAAYSSAQYFALAVFTPLMAYTLSVLSWHYIFVWTGLLGVIMGVVWIAYVRAPDQHPNVNAAEKDYIREGGGVDFGKKGSGKFSWALVKQAFGNRTMVGIFVGQFCLTTISWFFLTWFPTYLLHKGVTILQAGLFTAIPALAGFLGGIVGGSMSDYLVRSGASLSVARKAPIIIGFIFSTVIVVANYVDSKTIIVLVMSIAFFAKGFGNLGWAILGDVSPVASLGLNGGMFNFCGNVASIITPIVIGVIFKHTGSFNLALVYVGSMSVIGAISYLLLVGKVQRIA